MKILMLVVVSFLVSPAALAAMNSGSTPGTKCSAHYNFMKQGPGKVISGFNLKGKVQAEKAS